MARNRQETTLIVCAERTYRIGHQKLLTDFEGNFWVQIDNRTYHSRVPIPASKARIWYDRLSGRDK